MDIEEIDWMEVAVKANQEKKEANARLQGCITERDNLRQAFEKDLVKLKRELKKEKDRNSYDILEEEQAHNEIRDLRRKLEKKEENASRPMPTPNWVKLVGLGEQDKAILKFLQKYKLCPDMDRISSRTGISIYDLSNLLNGLLHNNLIATQDLNGGTWYQITPAGVFCLSRWSKLVKPKKEKLKLAIKEVCEEIPRRSRMVPIEDLCSTIITDGLDGVMKYRGVGKVFRKRLEDSITKRGIAL